MMVCWAILSSALAFMGDASRDTTMKPKIHHIGKGQQDVVTREVEIDVTHTTKRDQGRSGPARELISTLFWLPRKQVRGDLRYIRNC